MTIAQIRSKRIAQEIAAVRLAKKAGIDRVRLSYLENGHREPTEPELLRLATALDQLIAARSAIRDAAIASGWSGTPPGRTTLALGGRAATNQKSQKVKNPISAQTPAVR